MSNKSVSLVTNRTLSDVDEARYLIATVLSRGIDNISESQRERFMSGLRGCYNISDLNRVEDCIQYISYMLAILGTPVDIPAKYWNRVEGDELVYPTIDELWDIVVTINELAETARQHMPVTLNTIYQTAIVNMNYTTANNIEINLQMLCEALETLVSPIWISSGCCYSGNPFYFSY